MDLFIATAAAGNYSLGEILTFAIPIGTLALVMAIGFYQRKPQPDSRRVHLFPLRAIPQRRYDIALFAALSERDRSQLTTEHAEGQAGSERPVGGA